ncbi:MAG: DNA repair protein RadC [Candidatus Sumerlaeia bacterium]|nr:DNA repair protein RadC [Candidatus Sumerlaeia bacterium]
MTSADRKAPLPVALDPAQALVFLDRYESMKEVVVARSPEVAVSLRHLGETNQWQSQTLEEARTLAVLALLQWDATLPTIRRKARRVVREFAPLPKSRSKALSVKEEPEGLELTPTQLKKVERLLEAFTPEVYEHLLHQTSSSTQAIEHLSTKVAVLKGMAGYEFLALLGYPLMVPDAARIRWLDRMGYLETNETEKNRSEQARTLEELGHSLGVHLAEFNLVLGAFCGSLGQAHAAAGICLKKPLCSDCPIQLGCSYYRFSSKTIEKERRNLLATTRKEERPRERLETRGASVLSDAELLAILLRTGTGQSNAVETAQTILKKAETLDRLAQMSLAEMAQFKGMGRVKSITLKAAFELAKRLQQSDANLLRPKFNSARSVYLYLKNRFLGEKRELFVALHLNTKLELIRELEISAGIANQTLVHPRECFAEALRDGAVSVIFAHNHPSGDPTPSRADDEITKKLVECGRILSINVRDHLVVGSTSFYSYSENDRYINDL